RRVQQPGSVWGPPAGWSRSVVGEELLMARVLLITNPVAARTDPRVVRAVCEVFAAEGWETDVAGTTRHGDASRLAAQGVEDGVDVIAVYGGYGTTVQAGSAVVGVGIPLALIPGG